MAKYAALLGGLGAVAVVFALLSFLIQLLSGGGLLLQRELAFSFANLVLGLALLAISLGTNLERIRERMRSGEARRAGKYGTSAVLSTVLGIALLVLLAFLSTRYHHRFDWTEAKSHSLTDQSLKTLAGLEESVKVTGLFAQIAAGEAQGSARALPGRRARQARDRVRGPAGAARAPRGARHRGGAPRKAGSSTSRSGPTSRTRWM